MSDTMETKKTIKSNEELYGDFELIPLNLDAVNQRILFFRGKVELALSTNDGTLDKYHKAWEFWKEIKEKHCING